MQLIFEKSRPGRRAYSLPRYDLEPAELPEQLRRGALPRLPELAEPELLRHFTALSRRAFGVDNGFYPLGSCTMKHNPRVGERVAALPGFRDLHPHQEEEAAQGALELMWRLQQILAEIAGLPAVSLQPAAGAQGELTGLTLMRAYFADRGEAAQRRKIVIPDTAHGTNPASVTMTGFELTPAKTDARGNIDVEHLRSVVDEQTAGLMLTNPSTLGLFDENIEEIEHIFHSAGALMYYDGANLNALCGISRPGDMGFDIVHFNLHKTFAQPHGGGGPGAGPVAVCDLLTRSCPCRQSCAKAIASASTTSTRSRSARCAGSTARSGCSSAPTRISGSGDRGSGDVRGGRPERELRPRATRRRTSCRSTGSACTSSSSLRGR